MVTPGVFPAAYPMANPRVFPAVYAMVDPWYTSTASSPLRVPLGATLAKRHLPRAIATPTWDIGQSADAFERRAHEISLVFGVAICHGGTYCLRRRV